ncbi:MAG TPA: hypothetical protein VG890_12360 [Puia sp.]|nr:hypothetical protein [Puia sp.]
MSPIEKRFPVLLLFCMIVGFSGFISACAQQKGVEPWTEKQLIAPAELANIMKDTRVKQPMILSVGPGAVISGSMDMGPAHEKRGLGKLRSELENLPKDTDIVIYCGCCPFDRCPNIRPAFALLNEMKFQHARLLNIEHNIKTDWIDKDYPSVKQ